MQSLLVFLNGTSITNIAVRGVRSVKTQTIYGKDTTHIKLSA